MSANQLFVGGLGDTAEDALRSLFSSFGEISACAIVRDKKSGKPRGFGFVTFTESASVKSALAKQNSGSLEVNGNKVECRVVQAKREETNDSSSSSLQEKRQKLAQPPSGPISAKLFVGGSLAFGFGKMRP